jgi:hypothetical protein
MIANDEDAEKPVMEDASAVRQLLPAGGGVIKLVEVEMVGIESCRDRNS